MFAKGSIVTERSAVAPIVPLAALRPQLREDLGVDHDVDVGRHPVADRVDALDHLTVVEVGDRDDGAHDAIAERAATAQRNQRRGAREREQLTDRDEHGAIRNESCALFEAVAHFGWHRHIWNIEERIPGRIEHERDAHVPD